MKKILLIILVLVAVSLFAIKYFPAMVGSTTDSYVEAYKLQVAAFNKTTVTCKNTGLNSMTVKLFGYPSSQAYDDTLRVPLEWNIGSEVYELPITAGVAKSYTNETATWYAIGVEVKGTAVGDTTSYSIQAKSWGQ